MNPGENLIVIAYVAGVILLFVLIFVLTSLSRRCHNKVSVLPEEYRCYTGRAQGRILEHHWKTHFTGQSAGPRNEDNIDATDSVYMVKYEFEVDGKTYKGEGEGSPALQGRKNQTICYDPSDPTKNYTLYYLNSKRM